MKFATKIFLFTFACCTAVLPAAKACDHGHGHEHGQGAKCGIQEDSLAGFDEMAIWDDIKKRNIPQSDVAAYMNYKKQEFIGKKYGTWQLPFDPNQSSFNKNGNINLLQSCNNVDFETGTFAGWQARYGFHPLWGSQACVTSANPLCPNNGFISGRHTIMSGSGFDPVIGAPLKMVFPGGSYSARLGNSIVGGEAEQLEQTFTVSASSTSFTYHYAVVLDDPSHGAADQPFFRIQVYLTSNNTLIPCAQYYVVAGAGIQGFQTKTVGFSTIRWKDWSAVTLNLSGYVGQNVTIRFTTSDCNFGGHYGYAYLDAECLGLALTQSDTLCQGGTIQLSAPSGYATYSWTPGGGTTQTISVTNGGLYSVSMVSFQGCTTVLKYNVIQNPTPVAAFNINSTACSKNVTFTNNSTIGGGGSITGWYWDFGDGGASNLQTPSYTYLSPGTYTVKLVTTSSKGCKDSTTKQVTISATPVVNFSNTTVCFGTATAFTDLSTLSGGTITQWTWTFGDGGSSTTQNPTHVYPSAGTYMVKLVAKSNSGCADSVTLPVIVNPIPVAGFVNNKVCFGSATQFNNASYVTSGAISSYSWNFGDPNSGGSNTSTASNPTHTYTSAGTFNVTLLVTSSGGCTKTIQQSVIVYFLPVANFSATTACLTNPTVFTDLSTSTNGTISGWSWSFGDGNNSVQQNPSHTYLTQGTYTVTLTVTSSTGCTATVSKAVTVQPKATAWFNASQVCVGSVTAFTDSSYAQGGTITAWSWNFGNGNTSSSQNPNHTYTSAGVYNVQLTVTTSTGCQATVFKPVMVHDLPTVVFNATKVCLGSPTQFTDSSYVTTGGTVTGWSWNFGDGNTSTSQNPTNTYLTAGTYTVTLTVTSSSGCTKSGSKTITVNPGPVANFFAPNVCTGNITFFTDSSKITGGVITAWSWDFGDPNSGINNISALQHPNHTFTSAGNYTVTLIVTSNTGCTSSVTKTVTVNQGPVVKFGVLSGCANTVTQFIDSSTVTGGTIVKWAWDFGDGSAIDTTQNPSHVYNNGSTVFNVILTVTSSNGCTASGVKQIILYPNPVVNWTAADVCLNTIVSFTDQTTVGSGGVLTTWLWKFGDGSTSNVQNPTHMYATDSAYTVTLIVTTDKGCIDSVTKTVTVFPNPVAKFTSPDTTGCWPLCVQFNDLSTIKSGTIVGWQWDFGDGNTSLQQNPNYCYKSPGTYTVTLTVTSNNGCTSVSVHPAMVTVYPIPVADFTVSPQPTTILNPLIHFTDQSIGASAWYWYFGDGDSLNFNDANPVHQYRDTGTYTATLIVKNQWGCIDSIQREVVIGPDFVFYVPNAFTPNGDGKNDLFFGTGTGIKDLEMFIYDRWGNMIFTTKQYGTGWDGHANGGADVAQMDVYVWLIKVTDVFDKKHKYVGHVTLVK